MRIVVNNIAAEKGGALTVLKSFYNYIRNHDNENEYVFLLSGNYIEENNNIKVLINDEVKKSGLHKMKFDFFTGKKYIAKLKPDYVLSLQNIITFGLKCRQGVYVHQSIPFTKVRKFSLLKSAERGTAIIQRFIGFIIKMSVRKADDVFVQTNWMRENVAEMSGVPIEKISTVPFDVELPTVTEKVSECPKTSFFYPATAESVYKNHECIYQAIDMLNAEEIKDFKVILTLDKNVLPKRENIEHCGMLSKDELYEAYRNNVMLFPSYIETIGLPLLEAQSVNSVIFASDCQYSREVLKDYNNAYFFETFNPEQLAQLMKKAMQGKIIVNSNESINVNRNGWKVLTDRIVN